MWSQLFFFFLPGVDKGYNDKLHWQLGFKMAALYPLIAVTGPNVELIFFFFKILPGVDIGYNTVLHWQLCFKMTTLDPLNALAVLNVELIFFFFLNFTWS
jgi:hypothetical protein